MLKKLPWKTVLLTLLAWMLFWEVKETVTGDRMFFLVRWMHSEIHHAKDIEVLTYLLTDEQVAYMLTHPNETVHQPTKKDLDSKNVNVVLRIRNLTDGVAWGRISWSMHGMGWNKVDVNEIPGSWQTKKYADIIIPVGIQVIQRQDSPPDPITVKWDTLYVYR